MELAAALKVWGAILADLRDNDFGDPEIVSAEQVASGAVNISGTTSHGWDFNYSSITKKLIVFTESEIEV